MDSVPSLVSTQWLQDNLTKPDVRIVQAVFPEHCYSRSQIPGGVEYDEASCCARSAWHTMLPDAELFQRYIGSALGVSPETHVVVYDASTPARGGLETAARVWFTFRAFGHARVSLLNGGLTKWLTEGRATADGPATDVSPAAYTGAALDPRRIVEFEDVERILGRDSAFLVDSRSAQRFSGATAEPAGGVSGAILRSISLPYPSLIDPTTGEFMTEAPLRALFKARGIDGSKPFVATCGTGTTACGLNIAAEILFGDMGALYDGSWYEYSRQMGINEMDECHNFLHPLKQRRSRSHVPVTPV